MWEFNYDSQRLIECTNAGKNTIIDRSNGSNESKEKKCVYINI